VPDFDPRTPSIARVHDYLLIAVFPAVVEAARENRQFIARAVTWVADRA
jgi:hypothetical protein